MGRIVDIGPPRTFGRLTTAPTRPTPCERKTPFALETNECALMLRSRNETRRRLLMVSPAAAAPSSGHESNEEHRGIFASSLGTVFEWYDFYLYATLAPFFAALFFPKENATAALLASFATYAAGFLVRPFGALVFGRIGDLVGRKYTFLITIVVM